MLTILILGEHRADLANLYRLLKPINGAQQVFILSIIPHFRPFWLVCWLVCHNFLKSNFSMLLLETNLGI